MHHEIGIAQDILRLVLQKAKDEGISKVSRIKIRIGEFYLSHPDQISFSFDLVSKGTIAENARIEVVTSKISAMCSSCKKNFNSPGLSCPFCGGKNIAIKSGQELLVESLN